MSIRKVPIVNGEIYHVYTKSIAGFTIFNKDAEYERMEKVLFFYRFGSLPTRFSEFERTYGMSRIDDKIRIDKAKKIVEIIAYCLMPTHIHFLLKQINTGGVSEYMGKILNSYSKYFNSKYKRKGPLWEGRFENRLVKDDSDFLHLTRYIHLNPSTAHLISCPEDWKYSSYSEYLGVKKGKYAICDHKRYVPMPTEAYREFANDRIDYQRKLASIKHLILE